MTLFKGKKIFLYLFLSFIVFALLYLTFNESGFIKYSTIKREMDSLNLKISENEIEIRKLKNEIDSLEKKIPSKIEKIAREKFNMSRKNEVVIKVNE